MKTIAITFDETLVQRLDRLAEGGATRQPRAQLIRQAVQEYLEKREQLAEEERERAIFRQQRQRLALEAEALVQEQAQV